uniref:RxLR effector protein n=1 Tax=Peronospora matthiolae TaxID=2874970 RepID=A0AAV1UFF5_9STRA
MRFTVAAFAAAAAIACSTSDAAPVLGAPYQTPTLLTRGALHGDEETRFLRGYETDAAAINNHNAEERGVAALSTLHPNPTLKNKELPAAVKAPIRFVMGLIKRIFVEVRNLPNFAPRV